MKGIGSVKKNLSPNKFSLVVMSKRMQTFSAVIFIRTGHIH